MSKIYWELLVAYDDNTWESVMVERPEGVDPNQIEIWYANDGPGKHTDNIAHVVLYYEMTPSESQAWQESQA